MLFHCVADPGLPQALAEMRFSRRNSPATGVPKELDFGVLGWGRAESVSPGRESGVDGRNNQISSLP